MERNYLKALLTATKGTVLLMLIVSAGLALMSWYSHEATGKTSPVEGPLLVGNVNMPNWVSTMTVPEDEKHYMAPVKTPANPLAKVEDVISRAGLTVINKTDTYLHAQATTHFFRFIDDVEFLYDREAGLLHYRSASRIGFSDMGTNRIRMQELINDLGL